MTFKAIENKQQKNALPTPRNVADTVQQVGQKTNVVTTLLRTECNSANTEYKTYINRVADELVPIMGKIAKEIDPSAHFERPKISFLEKKVSNEATDLIYCPAYYVSKTNTIFFTQHNFDIYIKNLDSLISTRNKSSLDMMKWQCNEKFNTIVDIIAHEMGHAVTSACTNIGCMDGRAQELVEEPAVMIIAAHAVRKYAEIPTILSNQIKATIAQIFLNEFNVLNNLTANIKADINALDNKFNGLFEACTTHHVIDSIAQTYMKITYRNTRDYHNYSLPVIVMATHILSNNTFDQNTPQQIGKVIGKFLYNHKNGSFLDVIVREFSELALIPAPYLTILHEEGRIKIQFHYKNNIGIPEDEVEKESKRLIEKIRPEQLDGPTHERIKNMALAVAAVNAQIGILEKMSVGVKRIYEYIYRSEGKEPYEIYPI